MVRHASRVEEAVGRVSLWHGKAVTVSPLSGGLTNENYLVETDGERYVLRIPGASTELLSIDRANELCNTRAAASTGIGASVLEHIPELNAMVLEFIPGPTMSAKSLQSLPMARRMAESFRRLHSAPRFMKDFNMFRLIDDYLRIVEEHDVTIPADYRERLTLVAEIEEAVRAGALPSVSCHNDLLCENFIDDGRWLRIVDYELSGNNDPCFDLGNTAQEAGFGDELRAALCEAYFGRHDRQQLARMNLFALMSDIGWTLWGAIQARISSIDFDFTDYYLTRWNRATTVMTSARLDEWLREARALDRVGSSAETFGLDQIGAAASPPARQANEEEENFGA
jgi:thiamine kinase-like enzyme